jgi:secreted trypsin-like serine protease
MREGAMARGGQFPWHVSVGIKRINCPPLSPLEGHRGGGTLIGSRWVLTAAHCLVEISHLLSSERSLAPPPGVHLRVARGVNLDVPDEELEVTTVELHPRYNRETLEYDAALLQLSQDVEGAIEFGRDEVAPGECGVVAGWGETRLARQIVPHLSWARFHVASADQCARESFGGLTGLPDKMFAAGGCQAGCPGFPSACIRIGDSGGGFVVNRRQRPVVYGIVSWSAWLFGDAIGPHVMTRTSRIADWIKRATSSS